MTVVPQNVGLSLYHPSSHFITSSMVSDAGASQLARPKSDAGVIDDSDNSRHGGCQWIHDFQIIKFGLTQ